MPRRSRSTGASSIARPAYMTTTSSATSATTPRSCVIMMIAVPCSACSCRISSRICACVVTSSAVVGSSAISRSGSLISAIAIITRCRMPPGELVRVVVDPLAGLRDPDLLERRRSRAVACLLLGDVVVEQDRLAQLPAERLDRVQRGHRVLEDHRDLLPPQLAQAILARGEQVLAVEHRLAARRRVARVVQAHDRERRDALAAAGLADDPERLASVDRERDAVHRLDDAVVGLEARAQVADLEERHQLSRILGSNQA